MPAKNKASRAIRSAERVANKRRNVPQQPEGMPRGKHLSGFKGMKIDATCMCGRCNPNAKTTVVKVIDLAR